MPPSVFGISIAAAIAGALGAVATLQYMKDLTITGRFIAVVSGAATAAYIAPAVGHWYGWGELIQNAIAFSLGIAAMNIIPGIVKVSQMFASDPLGFLRGRGSTGQGEQDE